MGYKWCGSVLFAGAAAMLSSCQLPVNIDIRQLDNGRISIKSNDGTDNPPCIESIHITQLEEGKAPIDSPVIWWVDSKLGAKECFSEIVYPKVPESYSGEFVADLQPGRQYLVEASGISWSASETIVRQTPR